MVSRLVVVSASDSNHVTIYRGSDVSVFACGGRCQRSGSETPAQAATAAPPSMATVPVSTTVRPSPSL
jgi:hypothetical protein